MGHSMKHAIYMVILSRTRENLLNQGSKLGSKRRGKPALDIGVGQRNDF